MDGPSSQTGGATTVTTAYTSDRPVTYMCSDCNSDVTLKRGDPLRCTACGHRVLQKKRTTR